MPKEMETVGKFSSTKQGAHTSTSDTRGALRCFHWSGSDRETAGRTQELTLEVSQDTAFWGQNYDDR